jgi:DNA-binding NtrC family response regulator
MAKKRPSALVIDRDGDSRRRIDALLQDTGFAITDCAQCRDGWTALVLRKFDIAIIAGELRDGSDGLAAARRMQRRQSGLKVIVIAPADAAPPPINDDDLRLVARPLDERQLRRVVLELMTPEADAAAAELGVIEAQLACLFDRREAAARGARGYLARDIAHQIGDAMAARQNLRQSHAVGT